MSSYENGSPENSTDPTCVVPMNSSISTPEAADPSVAAIDAGPSNVTLSANGMDGPLKIVVTVRFRIGSKAPSSTMS